MAKSREEHLAEYTRATEEEWMKQVKVEGDDREWFYTAKKIRKGILMARVYYSEPREHGQHWYRKKLVPYDQITFI